MPAYHGIAADHKKIAKAVAALEKRFAPEVVRVRYTVREDWTGDPSVYFRVLLTDKAAHPDRLGDISSRLRRMLREEIRPEREWDLNSYVSFRSVSEQEEMREPEWD